MARIAGLLAGLTGVLAVAFPLHADVAATLASQVRADVAVLSSEPTLSAWQSSHARSKVELAHYETEKDPYSIDFTRLNRWCAASVETLQPPAVRAALFYVPSVSPGALPPLPSEDGALTSACRMQAIWYATSGDTSIGAIIEELSSFWGKPNGETSTPDIPGWDQWKGMVAWHRKGINIWTAYDSHSKPGAPAGSRLVFYARRNIPRDPLDLNVGSLPFAIMNQVTDTAAQMTQQDPTLTAGVLKRTRCRAQLLKPEAESVTVRRLAQWLKSSEDLPPARRASTLLVADAYLSCAQFFSKRLVDLGATFGAGCPQDGAAYDGNFCKEAEKLDPKGLAGELAGLASLGEPCLLKGRRPWPDLVIQKGETLLSEYPPNEWTPWFHFAIAGAHAAKLCFAYPGVGPEVAVPLPRAAMRQQRTAAIARFEDFIREKPDAPESVFAWQEAWRLLARLPPTIVTFGCSCE